MSAGRNAVFLLSSQFASLLIRLVYLLIMARTLPPEAYGALSYALSWYLLFLPATYLGADVVLSREIARARETAPALLGATLGLRVCAITLVTAASILLANLLENDAYLRILIVLFSFSLLGRSLWMWCASAFTAFEEARLVLRFEVAFRFLEVGVLIFFLLMVGPDLWSIAIIHACSWLLQAVAAIGAVRRRHAIRFTVPAAKWLKVLRDGIPGAALAFSMAAFFQLPIVLFRQVEGLDESLGHFALSFQILTYLLTIPYVIATASLPVLSRSAVRGDGKDRAAVVLLVAIIVVGGALVTIAGSFFASPAVVTLFGLNYASAAQVLAEGLWLLIPASLAIMLQHVLFSYSARVNIAAAAPLVGSASMAALFPVLTRENGEGGALTAVAVGLLTWCTFTLIALFRTGFFKNQVGQASASTSSH